jgi:hypothetical protein
MLLMAICSFCNHDMSSGESCTETHLHIGGTAVPLPVYRKTRRLPLDRCGDCGVAEGGFHHPGCDLQDCPRCGRQLAFMCDCPWDEHEAERAEEEGADEDLLGSILPFGPPEVARPPREIPPFGSVVGDLRAKFRVQLHDLGSWALAGGRGCDLDVAAAFLEVAERHLTGGGLLLTRVDITSMLTCDLRNLASLRGTVLPDGDMEAIWTTITWCHATGRLAPASDPLAALLEPLQCYGMLGADGRPRPKGTDVDFVCQCYLPHDPTCPPGQAQRMIGHQRESFEPMVLTARWRQRSDDPPVSCLAPLLLMARQSRREGWVVELPVDAFIYEGRVDPDRGVPELWIYRLTSSMDHYLFLDDDGHAWHTKPDRRRKAGFRMVLVDGRGAMHRCGAFGLVIAEERLREESEDDLWEAQ